MEKILIKVIEEKIENLKETKIERVKEIAKEHKLDVAYETLMKYEKDALREIENRGDGSTEAKKDLEKIESEKEKIKLEVKNIEKNVENEIALAEKNLEEVEELISKKEEAQKNIQSVEEVIEKLNKYKDEALAEIKSNGNGKKEAKKDLEKIENELEEKIKIKEENQKNIAEYDKKINKYIEKYNIKDYVEEQVNKDLGEEIKENEELDIKKAKEQEQREIMQVQSIHEEQIQRKQDVNEKISDVELNDQEQIIINEGNNEVITKDKDGNTKIVRLTDVLECKKELMKMKNIDNCLRKITKNPISRFLLKRKINPAIIEALNNDEKITKYIRDLKNKNPFDFELTHNLNYSVLEGKEKHFMRRVAKQEIQCYAVVQGLTKIKFLPEIKNRRIRFDRNPKEILDNSSERYAKLLDKKNEEEICDIGSQRSISKVQRFRDRYKAKRQMCENVQNEEKIIEEKRKADVEQILEEQEMK